MKTSGLILCALRRAAATAVSAVLFGCAFPAWAAGPVERRLAVGEGQVLHPGMVVRVTWDSLPPATEEFELLLKIEKPARLKVRLTECQDPSRASLLWRVPDLPCPGARLVLRRGEGGRETTWAVSEPLSFSAAGRPLVSRDMARVERRAGELWLTRGRVPSAVRLEPDPRLAPEVPAPGAPAGLLSDSDEELAGAPAQPAPPLPAVRRRVPSPLVPRATPRSPLRLQLRI